MCSTENEIVSIVRIVHLESSFVRDFRRLLRLSENVNHACGIDVVRSDREASETWSGRDLFARLRLGNALQWFGEVVRLDVVIARQVIDSSGESPLARRFTQCDMSNLVKNPCRDRLSTHQLKSMPIRSFCAAAYRKCAERFAGFVSRVTAPSLRESGCCGASVVDQSSCSFGGKRGRAISGFSSSGCQVFSHS